MINQLKSEIEKTYLEYLDKMQKIKDNQEKVHLEYLENMQKMKEDQEKISSEYSLKLKKIRAEQLEKTTQIMDEYEKQSEKLAQLRRELEVKDEDNAILSENQREILQEYDRLYQIESGKEVAAKHGKIGEKGQHLESILEDEHEEISGKKTLAKKGVGSGKNRGKREEINPDVLLEKQEVQNVVNIPVQVEEVPTRTEAVAEEIPEQKISDSEVILPDEIRDQNYENKIMAIHSKEDLFNFLKSIPGIYDTDKLYSANDLISMATEVLDKKDKKLLDKIPRKNNLRLKVYELMIKEGE